MDKLYIVTFTNGQTMEEYGSSIADVKDFLNRCFSHLEVKDITLKNK